MVSFITAVEMDVDNVYICVEDTNEQNNAQQTDTMSHTYTYTHIHALTNLVPCLGVPNCRESSAVVFKCVTRSCNKFQNCR